MALTYKKTDRLEKMLEEFVILPDDKEQPKSSPETPSNNQFTVNVTQVTTHSTINEKKE